MAITRQPGVKTGPLGDRMAEFLERYPNAQDLYITSAIDGDHGGVSHHYGLQYKNSPTAALDIGAGTPPDDAKMRDFAKWLYDNYADYTVELIHSTPFHDDQGFYVKNQVRNPGGSIYGGPQAIGHYDHIHWATSADLLTAAEQAAGLTPTAPVAEAAQPAAQAAPAPGEPAATAGIANTAPVWGWDASNHDWDPTQNRGPMDLVSAQRDGISFFIHKATEGSDWKDDHFKEALERARAAGIPVLGTYHFLWPEDVDAQVAFWMDYVDQQTPWWKDVPWIWQIDAEKSKNAPRMPNSDEIGQAVQAVRRRMAMQGTTGYVIAYTPRWAYQNDLGPGYDIWNSDYRGSGAARAFKEQYQGVSDFSGGWSLMSGRKPRILQFASDGVVGRQNTCDVNKFDGDLHALIRLCGRDPGRIGAPPAVAVASTEVRVTEKVLPYNSSIVPQDTYYDCGPASAQVVLNSLGINVDEGTLCREIGTDTDGTDCVQLIEAALDNRVPAAKYSSVNLPNDPPTLQQRETLWSNIVQSIDAGYGVVMNWVAPPNNYPRGVKGSVSPNYHGNPVMHYVACMGYDANPALRAVKIADSGFSPHEYWVSFDQAATLIPPKAYAYAAAGPIPISTQTEQHVPDQQVPGPSSADRAALLSQAMGGALSAVRYRALLPAVTQALGLCGCTTVDRIAMWMAQIGHESVGLQYMTELGGEAYFAKYNNRTDLGNGPADGPRFRGRGPIQVTGRLNYTNLSKWAHDKGLVSTPTFFVDDPEQLASDRYGFIGVVWYWTVARNMNSYGDHADIEGGSIAVNGRNPQTGRANGIEDRIARWNRCRDMGTALLALTGPVTPEQVTPGEITAQEVVVSDTKAISNATAGVDAKGWPLAWRYANSRYPREFNEIVQDPKRGPWHRTLPDGSTHDGHTDAYEQIVPINEQIAWRHTFSDGVTRDSGDVLLELMEFAIEWRKANKLPTSGFPVPGPSPDGRAAGTTTASAAAADTPPNLGADAGSQDEPAKATTKTNAGARKNTTKAAKKQPAKVGDKGTAMPAKKDNPG